MKKTSKAILAAASIIFIYWVVVFFFMFSPCWVEITEARNQSSIITAKRQKGNATTPGVLGIFIEKSEGMFSADRDLFWLINWHREARIQFANPRTFMVSTFTDTNNYVKTYFFSNLDHLPRRNLKISSNDQMVFSNTMSLDSTEMYKVTSRQVLSFTSLSCISIGQKLIMGDSLDWNVYVLNSDSVKVKFPSSNTLKLIVNWKDDVIAEEICVILPEISTGFIDAACNAPVDRSPTP